MAYSSFPRGARLGQLSSVHISASHLLRQCDFSRIVFSKYLFISAAGLHVLQISPNLGSSNYLFLFYYL